MKETCTNKNIAEMMADPRVKELLEMLQNDDEIPSELLDKLCDGGLPDGLLDKLMEDDEVDENKIKQADTFFEGIKSFIEENEWHTSVIDKENRVLAMGFSMRNATLKVMIRIDAEAESVTINSILPISCLEEYRMLMGSKLSQINETLRYGGFCLDENDGEITYRFTYSISGQEFNKKMFDNYLDCCLITPDIHYKKIVKIATGAMTKDERVAVLEKLKALAVAINE